MARLIRRRVLVHDTRMVLNATRRMLTIGDVTVPFGKSSTFIEEYEPGRGPDPLAVQQRVRFLVCVSLTVEDTALLALSGAQVEPLSTRMRAISKSPTPIRYRFQRRF